MPEFASHTVSSFTQDASLPLIFILGNSYSGSTLLGFLLSSSQDIAFVGEVKSKNWNTEKICSCGVVAGNCLFYGPDFEKLKQLQQEAIGNIRHLNPLYFLFFRRKKLSEQKLTALRELQTEIAKRLIISNPGVRYWTDSSKSLWLLNAWLQSHPASSIKTLWIKRSLHGNVASFMKRGDSFWYALVSAVLNAWLTRLFVRRNRLQVHVVQYDAFYAEFEKESAALTAYLGVKLGFPENSFLHHHVISGNRSTRNTFGETFQGFRKDNEWQKILQPWQQKIISWLS